MRYIPYFLFLLMIALWAVHEDVVQLFTPTIGPPGGHESILGIIVAALLVSALGTFGLMITRYVRKGDQSTLNDQASKVRESVRENEPTTDDFILFLRPFLFDGALQLSNWTKSPWRFSKSFWMEDRSANVDELVRRMSDLPVIKIGSLLDDIGSGVLTSTENSWFSDFKKLSQFARFIIIVPFATQSSKLELLHLRDLDLLDKCLFAVPRITPHQWMSESDQEWIHQNQQDIWQHSLEMLRNVGMTFPAVQAPCLFFRSTVRGEVRWFCGKFTKNNFKNGYYYFIGYDDLTGVTSKPLFGSGFEQCLVASQVEEKELKSSDSIDIKLSELRLKLQHYVVHKANPIQTDNTSRVLRNMRFANREEARTAAQWVRNFESARKQEQKTGDIDAPNGTT